VLLWICDTPSPWRLTPQFSGGALTYQARRTRMLKSRACAGRQGHNTQRR